MSEGNFLQRHWKKFVAGAAIVGGGVVADKLAQDHTEIVRANIPKGPIHTDKATGVDESRAEAGAMFHSEDASESEVNNQDNNGGVGPKPPDLPDLLYDPEKDLFKSHGFDKTLNEDQFREKRRELTGKIFDELRKMPNFMSISDLYAKREQIKKDFVDDPDAQAEEISKLYDSHTFFQEVDSKFKLGLPGVAVNFTTGAADRKIICYPGMKNSGVVTFEFDENIRISGIPLDKLHEVIPLVLDYFKDKDSDLLGANFDQRRVDDLEGFLQRNAPDGVKLILNDN